MVRTVEEIRRRVKASRAKPVHVGFAAQDALVRALDKAIQLEHTGCSRPEAVRRILVAYLRESGHYRDDEMSNP